MTICSASCQAACAIEAQGRKLWWMRFPPGHKTQQSSPGSAPLGAGAEDCLGNSNKGSLGSWLGSWGTAVPQLHCSICGVPAPSVLGCTSPCPVQAQTQQGLLPNQRCVPVPAPQDTNPRPFTLPRAFIQISFPPTCCPRSETK